MPSKCGASTENARGTFRSNSATADAVRRIVQDGKLSGSVGRVAERLARTESEVPKAADWIYDQVEGHSALHVSVLAEFLGSERDLSPIARRRVTDVLCPSDQQHSGGSLVRAVGAVSQQFAAVHSEFGKALADGIVEPHERTTVIQELRTLAGLIAAELNALEGRS